LINLSSIEDAVQGEPGKVYSTAPRIAVDEDGKPDMAKASIAARHSPKSRAAVLQQWLVYLVPNADIGNFQGELYAAVEEVPYADRNIEPWLKSQRILNPNTLFEVIAVDTWLANDDRNMGNLIASVSQGMAMVYMIDFEKSRALMELPFTGVSAVDTKQFWPTGDLGKTLRARRPSEFPAGIIADIGRMSDQHIRDIIQPVAEDLNKPDWFPDSVEVLVRRGRQIDKLVKEVWGTK